MGKTPTALNIAFDIGILFIRIFLIPNNNNDASNVNGDSKISMNGNTGVRTLRNAFFDMY